MKKKILTFLCFIFMTFGMFTGCSGFVMDDESLIITSITSEVLEDGRTMVVITYADEEIQPAIFYILKGETGEQGEEGNGIKEITHELDERTNTITVTITFTDPSIDPVTFELSNGVSIKSLEEIVDEETGEVSFVLHYTDGTSSEPISVPKGENGKDGSMIVAYRQTVNEDGSVTLQFAFSTGEVYTCDIPAPQKGEDGRGIVAIVGTTDELYYYVTFTYNDETTETIKFDKPVPNTWHTGIGTPSNSLGNNGDFYFDTSRKDIYTKMDGEWIKIVDFEDSETKYTVEFDLNSEDASFPDGYGYSNYYLIKSGYNFASSGYLVPIPVRIGYTFEGWYTTPNPTVVNGAFTDLTHVSSDMKLFAKWSQIEE